MGDPGRNRRQFIQTGVAALVVWPEVPDMIFSPGRAVEAAIEARRPTRFATSVSPDKDPDIHLKILSKDFDFDTVHQTHVAASRVGRL